MKIDGDRGSLIRPKSMTPDCAKNSRKPANILESTDGEIFTGCNIENSSYGLTVCAERIALWKALSEGARRFRAIAVVTDSAVLASPCGACRQLLWEYCGDITVHTHSLQGISNEYKLAALLPIPFDNHNLNP